MSDFMERARAEAERRTRPPGISGQTLPSMEQVAERDGLRRGFEAGAAWARDVLLAGPTDGEVLAAAAELMRDDPAAEDGTYGVEDYLAMARAAIGAFLAERRGSE